MYVLVSFLLLVVIVLVLLYILKFLYGLKFNVVMFVCFFKFVSLIFW